MSTSYTNDIIRIVLFALAWVNSILVAHGVKPIPAIDQNEVSWVITFLISVWAMLKESPFKKFFAKKASEAAPEIEKVASEVDKAATAIEANAPKVEAAVNEAKAIASEAEARAPQAPAGTEQVPSESPKA